MPRPLRRRLLVIGGAEDLIGPATILRRFVRLAGGSDARIAVLATASRAEAVQRYREAFGRLGVGEVLDVRRPEVIDDATGVFLTDGDPLRIAETLAGTALGRAVAAGYERGAVVAGTSSGASALSRQLICSGDDGVTPRHGAVELGAGLGLLPDVIIDQHLDRRSRYGRLLAAVARSPGLVGLGVDEDTAALVTDGRDVEVIGSGAVFVVDASAAVTDACGPRPGRPLLVSGAVLHSLPAGTKFDLTQRASRSLSHRRRPVVQT
jgi:cyanophycinase